MQASATIQSSPASGGSEARRPEHAITNILSIDLEDWHQLVQRRLTGEEGAPGNAVDRQLDRVLSLLAAHQTKATFFVLGMLAAARPELVKRIAAAGHEIACHGYAHLRVYEGTRERFREDTRRAQQTLEDIAGTPVLGYRAAEFSIARRSLWALDELAALGFQYDSSIFPIRHRRYGIPGFWPQAARYRLPEGGTLIEVPLATFRLAGQRLPFAGGGYFRLLPFSFLARTLGGLNRRGLPVTTYFHPYEFDTEPLDARAGLRHGTLRQKLAAARLNWHQNLGRAGVGAKLERLLQRFRFTTCADFLKGAQLDDGRTLLPAAGR